VVVGVQPSGAGNWRVTFRVTNLLADALVVEDAWLPHGRFRGSGHVPLGLSLDSGGYADVTLEVASDEPVGTVVRNAFLILRLRGWRVFTRMRIEFDEDGMHPIVEAITANTLTDDAAVT
jgi:hypothetical protein